MFDKVTIAYRGENYEIGRARGCYGIWAAGASGSQPVQWWPETPEGWSQAWSRFVAIETPGTIGPVGRNAAAPGRGLAAAGQRLSPGGGEGAVTAALLLVVGVVLGVAGLFPAYLSGASLASQPANLVAHVMYLAAWSASAALIPLGGTRMRTGALLATGVSAVTFGLFFGDLGTAIAGGGNTAGAGLVLGLLGWLACAAGCAVAFRLRPAGQTGRRGPLGRPGGAQLGPAILLMLAGLGAAIAFAPAWDSYTLRTAAGQTQSLTAGNAFADPGWVIVGNVAVMVALAAAVIAAALWRPVRHGAALLAGAAVPMAAQAISALVQAGETASPAQFGISSAQASQLGLAISSGLTPTFWVYSLFVLVLVVSCAWMFAGPHQPSGVLAGLPADAGPAAGGAAGVPEWHVAQPGNSYQESEGGDPSDAAVTPVPSPAPTRSAAGQGDGPSGPG